ncbi:MAG: hypothetical protein CTY25_09195 [Methylobacterium sp.]|nr:MAG: hypothetical protein CTY25_09195 [Methylobacterium sp.]
MRQQKQRKPIAPEQGATAGRRPRGRPRKLRAPSVMELRTRLGPRLAEAVAANWQGCSLREMRAGTRSTARIAEARQLGMYLAHTLFHLTMTRTGTIFGRDRTTVRHACRLIEDQRDRPRVDEPLMVLEAALSQWTEHFARRLAGDEP